ncbi:hypothetical protein HanRHA438_Chr16g0755511 [Helianthus annuus]|uniref:Uncharacterized protein n=1 Tax=Helianthus annuus TaxID=4232 RepID=A0A9K3GXH5_HELAN|nr:hypothetical protein HanXRQr2_Chr16g0743511 [Helianthus annuus]KAJ0437806.1 hypothetical protein HanHA300_Chr16g0606421 [Helianthus annuus]KAJ0442365.1 hypothetical protein HanIR_Chr16g0808361 [Helianthus annuus]KAJ0460129.1 hypothetical protein HanHA89_Chr16g0657001 [Helianthus annuus]KAJ0640572.1 hypothetical protein HanLR1_Chr16g0617031 [Helianthus annuus]
MKRSAARDEDDQATLTQMMEKKRKLLFDEKRELDVQAALDLSERKRKMMGQVATPSESEVDLEVFAKKSGNILEELYEEPSKRKAFSKSKRSTSRGSKDLKGKGPKEVPEKVSAEKVPPPVILGVVIQDRVEGLETDFESSESTPPQGTHYTRRVPSDAEGRGHSDVQRSPEFERVGAGGPWMAHNPTCDNLPHIPRWKLVKGSRMDNLDNYYELYSMSLPPAE